MTLKTLGAKVPPELYEDCRLIMQEKGWDISTYVRNALQMFVDVYRFERYRQSTIVVMPAEEGGKPSIEEQTTACETPTSTKKEVVDVCKSQKLDDLVERFSENEAEQ